MLAGLLLVELVAQQVAEPGADARPDQCAGCIMAYCPACQGADAAANGPADQPSLV